MNIGKSNKQENSKTAKFERGKWFNVGGYHPIENNKVVFWSDTFIGGNGKDTLISSHVGRKDIIDMRDRIWTGRKSVKPKTHAVIKEVEVIKTNSGNDIVFLDSSGPNQNRSAITVHGGNGSDYLIGTKSGDYLIGGDDEDHLSKAGNQSVKFNGGAGKDHFDNVLSRDQNGIDTIIAFEPNKDLFVTGNLVSKGIPKFSAREWYGHTYIRDEDNKDVAKLKDFSPNCAWPKLTWHHVTYQGYGEPFWAFTVKDC